MKYVSYIIIWLKARLDFIFSFNFFCLCFSNFVLIVNYNFPFSLSDNEERYTRLYPLSLCVHASVLTQIYLICLTYFVFTVYLNTQINVYIYRHLSLCLLVQEGEMCTRFFLEWCKIKRSQTWITVKLSNLKPIVTFCSCSFLSHNVNTSCGPFSAFDSSVSAINKSISSSCKFYIFWWILLIFSSLHIIHLQ